ncbi:YaeQ family protein [Nocardia sp. CDC159]|uniref:YaeQ family protein n=1 Tax=Nocardia pulmonis TaxID=2951408 RepID=A0A9X2IZI8_9NOCA|nr:MULTISPECIES: YaeQ family protein [Nocardia]MCM6776799.1 YaeQ family protein [Nocardia pulmonis]MCM6789052.1 YaeQ family protein [Nocardia sp. CDC159]
MALSATMHVFTVHLADVDRGVYEELELRVARHPSETAEFMLTRLLAYCLEYEAGIAFSDGGVSDADEPAVLVRDLTGQVRAWIEIGAPDAERVHRGSKLAQRVAVYTHRDPIKVLNALSSKRIHRGADIPVYSFDRDFIGAAVDAVDRRNVVNLSVTEGLLYLNLNGVDLNTAIHEHRLQ